MQFITNGYKRFPKTNSTDPRQCVPLNTQINITISPQPACQALRLSQSNLMILIYPPFTGSTSEFQGKSFFCCYFLPFTSALLFEKTVLYISDQLQVTVQEEPIIAYRTVTKSQGSHCPGISPPFLLQPNFRKKSTKVQ